MRRMLLGTVVVAYLLGVGFTVGVLAERVRFDRDRETVLRRYNGQPARMRAWLMTIERGELDAPARTTP